VVPALLSVEVELSEPLPLPLSLLALDGASLGGADSFDSLGFLPA
jgi:hypothetical protein